MSILKSIQNFLRRQPPGRIIAAGFALVILLGAGLLLLPCSVKPGQTFTPLDSLFTATSAVCVTGLVVVDAADTLTLFGQVVLALLIQIGGLGITSVGIALALAAGRSISIRGRSLVREAARLFPEAEIEIVETHHSRKADAPSGTARMLAAAIQKERPEAALVCGRSGFSPRNHSEIGISSIRLGSVTGIHEVLISTGAETLSLKHEAHDRRLFAEGALRAAVFLCGRQPGLYDMDDLLKGDAL